MGFLCSCFYSSLFNFSSLDAGCWFLVVWLLDAGKPQGLVIPDVTVVEIRNLYYNARMIECLNKAVAIGFMCSNLLVSGCWMLVAGDDSVYFNY